MKRENAYKQKNAMTRRAMPILGVCLLLMGAVTAVLLQLYQQKNEQVFSSLVEEALVSSHRRQAGEARKTIEEARRLLGALAAGAPEGGPDSGCLDAFRELSLFEDVQFLPAGELPDALAVSGGAVSSGELLQQLLQGETAVTDMYLQSSPEKACVFSVYAPVGLQDGQLSGALRGSIKAELLLGAGEKQETDRTLSLLLRRNGDVIQVEDEYIGAAQNLFSDLEDMNVPEKEQEEIRESMAEGGSLLKVLDSPKEGKFFLMVTGLGSHGWTLLSMAHTNDVLGYSSPILHNTVLLAAFLVLFLLLLAAAALGAYLMQRERLRRNQARYGLLSEFSDTILFEYDCRSQALVFTPNIAGHFQLGASAPIYPLDSRYKFSILHPEDREALRAILRNPGGLKENQLREADFRLLDRDGGYRWMRCQGRLLRDKRGRPSVLIGKLSDVHAQKSREEQLLQKSSIDGMTGVLNRDAAEHQISLRLKTGEKGFLFMLDVDNFKNINDTLGHSAGDRQLARMALEIKREFRQDAIVGRIGGDEFVVYLSPAEDRSAAAAKAERLLRRFTGEEGIVLTASIGIAAFPQDGGAYEALYEAADAAMYRAKRQGKNSCCFTWEQPAGK